MDKWFEKYIRTKLELASNLNKRQGNGDYSDAVLVLCTTLSCIAAILWPGVGIDKKRFIEALIIYCDYRYQIDKISLPMLMDALYAKKEHMAIDVIKREVPDSFCFYPEADSGILSSNAVDRSEEDIKIILPDLKFNLREYSYANLLYTEIRSGYVHEYNVGKRAVAFPVIGNSDGISYVNWVDYPTRRIHFSFPWLYNVTESIMTNVSKIINTAPIPIPHDWWIDRN